MVLKIRKQPNYRSVLQLPFHIEAIWGGREGGLGCGSKVSHEVIFLLISQLRCVKGFIVFEHLCTKK